MKSYHARKQIRALKDHENGAYNFVSNRISSRNSDGLRRDDSPSGSDCSSWDIKIAQEEKRRSMNVTGKIQRNGRPMRNKLERVATAGTYPSNRRMLNQQNNAINHGR